MPRQARLDAPGTLHHIIIRGIEKRRIVDDRKDREDFVSRMGALALDTETAIYAWSLMPNHAHILVRSGPSGLPKYMRKFLTGYAIRYNLRHKRHGHLFQNRYKSIVCEEDAYFLELVRYIHLNPLRAQLVEDISELDMYPWSGHAVVLGHIQNEWQDRDYMLSWFGQKEGEAKTAYRHYVQEGIPLGRRPELVGGGLIRSKGGWSHVLSARRSGVLDAADERILGGSDFVQRVIEEADKRLKYQVSDDARIKEAEGYVRRVCKEAGINLHELKGGCRRRQISSIRSGLARTLTEKYGLSLAETARQLGVSTPAISKLVSR
jgi:REP element-mobilizing transposase RayT